MKEQGKRETNNEQSKGKLSKKIQRLLCNVDLLVIWRDRLFTTVPLTLPGCTFRRVVV